MRLHSWNLTRNYDGSVLASMDAEGVWDFELPEFLKLTMNNLPVGSGGGGGGSSMSGSVGSLYYVITTRDFIQGYSVSNVAISGISSYRYLNGTYYQFPHRNKRFSFNYAEIFTMVGIVILTGT